MEITANSFFLRGESGIVKIVSDSTFSPGAGPGAFSSEAECDIAVESDGFRVNKAIMLEMSSICAFLGLLKRVLREGSGTASFAGAKGELSLKYIIEAGEHRVECEMNDGNEGKENFIRVKYPIEPAYFEDLARILGSLRECPAVG